MRRTLLARLAASLAFLTLTSFALAWIDTGHMVIAEVAQTRLKPEVRQEIDRLLAYAKHPKGDDIWSASCWADDIRGERPETGRWHFTNIHFRADGKPSTNKPPEDNIVAVITRFRAVLADRSKPDAERGEALRFLLHFVGDAHQPLHTTARDTDAFPKGDRGGNDFKIGSPPSFSDMSRPPTNLHFLWDMAGGLYREIPRPLTAEGKQRVRSLAEQLVAKHPEAEMPEAEVLDPSVWAQEGFELAKAQVYTLEEGTVPSDAYLKNAQEVSGQRLVLAGYRLARLLNQLLK